MSTSRRIIKNMAWIGVAEFATKGVSFFTNAYLARVILEEGFGYINFALATIIYFTTIVTLGFNAIGAREIARNPDEIKKYVNSIVSIRIILAIISFVILAVLIYFWDVSHRQTVIVLIASANIISAALMLDWYYQGVERMNILAIRQILMAVINLAGVLLLVRGTEDVEKAMYVLSGSTLLNAFWLFSLYIKGNGPVKFSYNKVFWTKLIRAAIPLSITLICITVLSNMSIIILGILIEDSGRVVGLFTAVIKIAVLMLIPINVIQVAFYPHLSRSDSIDSRQNAFQKYLMLNLLVGMLITSIIYFFPEFVINIIYGSRYVEAAPTLKLLMIWVAISYISQTVMQPLIAWKQEKTVMIYVLFAALLNIVLNYLLIPIYGMKGAAITSICIELVMAYLFVFAIKRHILDYPFLIIVKIFSLAAICSFAGYYLSQFSGVNILGIVFAIALYILIILGFKIVTINEIKGYIKR